MAVRPGDPPLVLLSIGRDEGVQPGFSFSIYRAATFVGKVQIERVNADSCAGIVLFAAEGQRVQAGDAAATRLD